MKFTITARVRVLQGVRAAANGAEGRLLAYEVSVVFPDGIVRVHIAAAAP